LTIRPNENDIFGQDLHYTMAENHLNGMGSHVDSQRHYCKSWRCVKLLWEKNHRTI